MGIRTPRPDRQRPTDLHRADQTIPRTRTNRASATDDVNTPKWRKNSAWAERSADRSQNFAPKPDVARGATEIGAQLHRAKDNTAATRPLPEIRYDSHDAGDFYCEHAYFVAQEHAVAGSSSVLTNADGDRLVGFLHLPEDDATTEAPNASPTDAQVAHRHADTRTVVGAAIAGYAEDARAQTEGPIRILISGYGPFGSATNNPSGDFVLHRSNLDAAMEEAFGGDLVGRPPASADLSQPLSYRIRQQNGSTRTVQLRALHLPVSDAALDPSRSGSIPSVMNSFEPHAVLSMGVRPGSDHFDVEGRADDGGLLRDANGTYRHERGRDRTDQGRTNGALQRAIEWARAHPN